MNLIARRTASIATVIAVALVAIVFAMGENHANAGGTCGGSKHRHYVPYVDHIPQYYYKYNNVWYQRWKADPVLSIGSNYYWSVRCNF